MHLACPGSHGLAASHKDHLISLCKNCPFLEGWPASWGGWLKMDPSTVPLRMSLAWPSVFSASRDGNLASQMTTQRGTEKPLLWVHIPDC